MAFRERSHDPGPAPDLAVQPPYCVVGADPGPVLHREVGVGKRLQAALVHDLCRGVEPHALKAGGHLVRLGHGRLPGLLGMYCLEHLRHQRALLLGYLGEHVAVEVDSAPLVAGLGKHLFQRPYHALALIACDHPHAREPAAQRISLTSSMRLVETPARYISIMASSTLVSRLR